MTTSENRYPLPPPGWITLREAIEIAERERAAEITMSAIRQRLQDMLGEPHADQPATRVPQDHR